MANPQKEDGYTPISNEILEHVYKLKLNGTQFKIILVIWRYTYGFSRKEHKLSESFIARATGTHRVQLSKEMSKLIKSNMLKVIKEATFTNPRQIAFNKNYEEWKLNDLQLVNSLTPSESINTTVSESTNTTVSESTNQDKQNIKQNLKQAMAVRFSTFWNAYPKKVGKAAAEKSFNKLKVDDELLKVMLEAIEKQKQSEQWMNKKYIPNPSTWLNQQRWLDEIDTDDKEDKVSVTFDGTFKF